jgi:hypothetical protein
VEDLEQVHIFNTPLTLVLVVMVLQVVVHLLTLTEIQVETVKARRVKVLEEVRVEDSTTAEAAVVQVVLEVSVDTAVRL